MIWLRTTEVNTLKTLGASEIQHSCLNSTDPTAGVIRPIFTEL